VCTKRSRIELRGYKYHHDSLPPPASAVGARGPYLAALVGHLDVANAEVLAPIPPVLVTGGAGGIRAKGLEP